jgi:hypothetical protein
MLSRTPGKSPAAARRAARTPLVAVDANSNINNFLHDDDDGPTTTSSSKKTPFKSSIAEKKRGVEKFTAVKSSTKKKRRSKSKIRRNDINNCDVCTTSCSPSPFVNNNNCSVPIIIAPADETHLNSFTIPIHESFHIYESDGEETFDFVANENIELETQTEENASSAVVVVAPIKPSTPRILFSAQQWEHKQCYTFASWLNKLFYPEGEEGGDAVNTISDEEINAEWSNANELFNSTYMQSIRNAVEREVKEGRLAIVPPRTERFVLDEVHVQEQLTKLLLSYTPRWLQLGLGIVLALNNTDGHNIKVSKQIFTNSLCVAPLPVLYSYPTLLCLTNATTDESMHDERIAQENHQGTCAYRTQCCSKVHWRKVQSTLGEIRKQSAHYHTSTCPLSDYDIDILP